MAQNNCNRCNRKLKDPNAQYGWRCAQILGIGDALNYTGDEAYVVYQAGMLSARAFLNAHKEIQLSDDELAQFYKAIGKAALAYSMDDNVLYEIAMQEACAILGCENEEERNQLLGSLSIEEYLFLKDQQDYSNGNYDTDGLLDDYDEQTAILQSQLIKNGYTDRFGNPLKLDGKLGPRTQWAADMASRLSSMQSLSALNSLNMKRLQVELAELKHQRDALIDPISNLKP